MALDSYRKGQGKIGKQGQIMVIVDIIIVIVITTIAHWSNFSLEMSLDLKFQHPE